MNPEQTKKVVYAVIILALAAALITFLYLIGKQKVEPSKNANQEKQSQPTTIDDSAKVNEEILKSLTAPAPALNSGSGTENAGGTQPAPVSQDVIKSLTAPSTPATTGKSSGGTTSGSQSQPSSSSVNQDIIKSLTAPK